MTRTLLIVAGGTGGHVMPGLAIAQSMRERGWQVRWIGTKHGIENTLVPQAGLRLDTINFAGMRGKGLGHAIRGLALFLAALWDCVRLIGTIRPQVVLGLGGYVTVPAGMSSALRGRPLVLLNSDAALLLSNRLLKPLAARILFGLPDGTSQSGGKSQWTGCPVRAAIGAMAPPAQRFAARTGPLRLLVIGGSLGAQVLNHVVPHALARLPAATRPLVTHQSGTQHCDALKAVYRTLGVDAQVVSFIDDMAGNYALCDLVIARAGAMTVSELTAAGLASILVPLRLATTTHQQDNARYMEKSGAAIYLPQEQLTPERLAEILGSLDRENLLVMAQAARALGNPHATETVADAIEAVANENLHS